MSHLVLELRPGEMMVVNGATIKFRSKCRIELISKARFLFGKQIMAEHEATSTIRRLYYELQTAYVGPLDERDAAASAVAKTLRCLEVEMHPHAASILARVGESFCGDDYYGALKLLRALILDENHNERDAGSSI